MNNYNDESFGFGNDFEEKSERTNDFNYDSISGLGESNYENEDLFNTEVDSNNNYSGENKSLNDNNSWYNDTSFNSFEDNSLNNFNFDDTGIGTTTVDESNNENSVNEEANTEVNYDVPKQEDNDEFDNFNIEDNIPTFDAMPESDEENTVEETKPETKEVNEEHDEIKLSDTPIEELNKLTEYDKEVIESADISDLFDKVSVNFKDASDIFKKNTDLKKKIDLRFDELKKLQSEIENSRKNQLDEIDKYKEEVYTKLTEKKNEIEKRLNLLKETQTNLENDKKAFEQYKKKELENIDNVQKEVQSAYDDRREELNHIEDVLRRQKDALDEERNQLSLDRIQYESDKNELANNLLKFNDLVNSFTNGVEEIKE